MDMAQAAGWHDHHQQQQTPPLATRAGHRRCHHRSTAPCRQLVERQTQHFITKYGWIYIKQTQNDNLTSDPPSALLRAGA